MLEGEENILAIAQRLTSQDRIGDYGHPLVDFSRTAALVTVLFSDKLLPGAQFEPGDIPLIQICVKLSRQVNKYKRDNLADIAGYARTAELVFDKLCEEDDIGDARRAIREHLERGLP